MGSMAREVGAERVVTGLKSFSAVQPSGRDGSVIVGWVVAIVRAVGIVVGVVKGVHEISSAAQAKM